MGTGVFAQTNPTPASAPKKNSIKLDLISPTMRTFNLNYERVISPYSSWNLGALYTDQSNAITNADYLSRFATTLEYRYYMGKNPAPRGMYLGAFARYQWMKTQSWNYTYLYDQNGILTSSVGSYEEKELNTGGFGINLGYQATFKDKIVVDMYFGPVYNSGDKRISKTSPYGDRPNDVFKPYVGYFLRSGLAVGFMF